MNEFHKDKNKKDGRTSYCKPCANSASKAHRSTEEGKQAHRKRNKEHYKNKEIVKKRRAARYGLTVEELDHIISLNDLCIICKVRKATVIDHCHVVGKVRGHLCNNCNTGIGLFKDQPVWLRAAANYIEAWDATFADVGELKIEFVTKEEHSARLAKSGEGTKLIP